MVYQAEFLAICKAACIAAEHSNSTRSVEIYSESLSALETITNSSAFHPLAIEARGYLRKALNQKKMYKIVLDQSPCRASRVTIVPTIWPDKLQRNPKGDSTTRAARFHSSSGAFEYVRLSNGISSTESVKRLASLRWLTGHGDFLEYLHRFKCKESPSCACDQACLESVLNLLLNCPLHLNKRIECEIRLGLAMDSDNLNTIISSDQRFIFLEYCIKICRMVIKRNSK
ncbi:unnamed protein product [Euphydryas editha]|uniref:RNase H type-1 domain-containing protein n=1 Tax=Euphydryas editha TaxID=104508 RepID=A0AAU9V161_EUPED|nr:unnamed protein product [Euphydryas editha]